MTYEFYKKTPDDKIWWVEDNEQVGTHPFSFDKKKVYHLFADYPHNMTDEEVEIFKKECPFWANFFKYRKKIVLSIKFKWVWKVLHPILQILTCSNLSGLAISLFRLVAFLF